MGKISDALKKVEKQRKDTSAAAQQAQSTVPQDSPRVPLAAQEQEIAAAAGSGILDASIVAYHQPVSPFAEQYRMMRTHLKARFSKLRAGQSMSSMKTSGNSRMITIASALPSEGKSVTCANIAVTCAHEHKARVLIIDTDVRKGSIHRLFGITPARGLTDILQHGSDYHGAVCQTAVEGLSILPCGVSTKNSAELLNSSRMREVLDRAGSDGFSYVFIDTPPLLTFTDACVVAAHTDGVLFAVQAYRTPVKAVKKAREFLTRAHVPVLGFALTHADYFIPHGDYYGYYQYGMSAQQPTAMQYPAQGETSRANETR